MDATTIKVVDWKGDVFWGTNVTKVIEYLVIPVILHARPKAKNA